jgi:hypothetical protein
MSMNVIVIRLSKNYKKIYDIVALPTVHDVVALKGVYDVVALNN